MTLSQPLNNLPTIEATTFKNLDAVINQHSRRAAKGEAFDDIERSVHAAFMETEREILSRILSQYDIDSPFVIFESKEYRLSIRCKKTIPPSSVK
jgi:hypothetical protein